MPFLLFLIAPVAFRTQRAAPGPARRVRGARRLPRPHRRLRDASSSTRSSSRSTSSTPTTASMPAGAAGPFVEAVTNGLALFTCAVVCAIAVGQWRERRARILAGAIGLLCLVGAFLSLERSVWIGAALGTCVAMLATPRRAPLPRSRWSSRSRIGVGAALIFVPGLHAAGHRSASTRRRPSGTARTSRARRSTWSRPGRCSASAGPLSAGQRRLLPAGIRLPADRHDLRRPQHPAGLRRRPRPRRRHVVGAGAGVRRRLRARHARAAGPPAWRIGLLTRLRRHARRDQRSPAERLAQPRDLAARRRRLQRSLPQRMTMDARPLPVTVIIPAYNRADTVARAVASALAQHPAPPAEVAGRRRRLRRRHRRGRRARRRAGGAPRGQPAPRRGAQHGPIQRNAAVDRPARLRRRMAAAPPGLAVAASRDEHVLVAASALRCTPDGGQRHVGPPEPGGRVLNSPADVAVSSIVVVSAVLARRDVVEAAGASASSTGRCTAWRTSICGCAFSSAARAT